MTESDRREFLQALTGVMAACRGKLSEDALNVWWSVLSPYPTKIVCAALLRYAGEDRKFPPTPGEIKALVLSQDGRPGPEAAWAMCPRDEGASVVWTEEMAAAWGVAADSLARGDEVQGRMVFLEEYRRMVAEARERGRPARWFASLGNDPTRIEHVLIEAERLGRLPPAQVAKLLPRARPSIESVAGLLSAPTVTREQALGALRDMKKLLDKVSR